MRQQRPHRLGRGLYDLRYLTSPIVHFYFFRWVTLTWSQQNRPRTLWKTTRLTVDAPVDSSSGRHCTKCYPLLTFAAGSVYLKSVKFLRSFSQFFSKSCFNTSDGRLFMFCTMMLRLCSVRRVDMVLYTCCCLVFFFCLLGFLPPSLKCCFYAFHRSAF